MINIHIIGNGTSVYAIRTLLEVNQDQFNDDIKVTCFGNYYFAKSLVYALNNNLTIADVISAADIVICTDPEFEEDNIVGLCAEQRKPLFCTFLLQNKPFHKNCIILDGINIENAASDIWVNRLLDVNTNVTKIDHYYGLVKEFDTGENSLPGITADEYLDATNSINGQPRLLWFGNPGRYLYAQNILEEDVDNVPVSYSWLIDTDRIDTSKVDIMSKFIFHTVIELDTDGKKIIKRSQLECNENRTIPAWFYINACVVGSFVYMYNHRFLPLTCNDYNMVDHSVFSDNIFGARFRIP